jgi:hypothetical protein
MRSMGLPSAPATAAKSRAVVHQKSSDLRAVLVTFVEFRTPIASTPPRSPSRRDQSFFRESEDFRAEKARGLISGRACDVRFPGYRCARSAWPDPDIEVIVTSAYGQNNVYACLPGLRMGRFIVRQRCEYVQTIAQKSVAFPITLRTIAQKSFFRADVQGAV